MEGGNNGPAVINGVANVYDRAMCFDAPVAFDTGLYVYPTKTLLQLRQDLMRRLGFAAMIAYPPPGMADLLNSFLDDAQEQLYMRPASLPLRTERWWAWQVEAGRRFYDVPIDCTKALDFRTVSAAYLSDNGGRALRSWIAGATYTAGEFVNSTLPTGFEFEVTTGGVTDATEPTWPGAIDGTVVDGTVTFTARAAATATWGRINRGINALEFSVANRGLPTNYELGEYLELWPVPDKTYVVWLRGHLGLKRFTEDTDECTIDARLIFLMALANAKAHYGQPDASGYMKQLEIRLGRLCASGHVGRRYIPDPAPYGSRWSDDLGRYPMPRATWR
jgi:hypothetical protein